MRSAGCPTAFCGSSGALVWLQTALMCLNYTDNNNEMCNNNNINRRVTVSQGKKATRWPEPALSWTLSATRKWIRVGSETWSSQGIWYGGGERVSGAGCRVPGTGNWDQGTWDRMSTHQMHVKVPLWKSQCESHHPLAVLVPVRVWLLASSRENVSLIWCRLRFFRVFLPQAEPFLHRV